MEYYTKENSGFWVVSTEKVDDGWEKVEIKDDIIIFPIGLAQQIAKEQLSRKILEKQKYLDSTEHKFNLDYEPKENEDLELIKAKRREARKFIRDNQ